MRLPCSWERLHPAGEMPKSRTFGRESAAGMPAIPRCELCLHLAIGFCFCKRRVKTLVIHQILVAGHYLDGRDFFRVRRHAIVSTFIAHHRAAGEIFLPEHIARSAGSVCFGGAKMRAPLGIRHPRAAVLARGAETGLGRQTTVVVEVGRGRGSLRRAVCLDG
jgi:hypothetical protein